MIRIISGLLTVALMLWLRAIYMDVLPYSFSIIELQLSFTKISFLNNVSAWGDRGVQVYLNTLWIDYIFPLAFGTFFYSLLVSLKSNRKITYLPIIAAASDYVENTLHYLMLSDTITITSLSVFTASLFSALKWISIVVSIAFIIFLSCHKFLNKAIR